MKILKLYHFKTKFGQTHYDKGNIYLSQEKENYIKLPIEIITFFDNHSKNVSESKKTQNIRFRTPYVEFLTHVNSIFNSIENFDEHTDFLADKFKNSMKRPPSKNFYLIFYITEVNNSECLSILTMEARNGIQVNGEGFNILKEILPDKDARLKKAALVLKKESIDFKLGKEVIEEIDGEKKFIRHATIIESRSTNKDVALSEYFFNKFLDGEVVADNPTAVSKILKSVIPNTVKPFLSEQSSVKDIKRFLKTKFSTETKSTFFDIISGVEKYLSKEKMEEMNYDIHSLSDLAFENALEKNQTMTKTFVAKYKVIPKTTIKDNQDDGRSIKISISKQSIDNQDVFIDKITDDTFHILKIKKSLVTIKET